MLKHSLILGYRIGGNMVSEKEIIQADAAESGSKGLYNAVYRFGEYMFGVLISVMHGIGGALMMFIDSHAEKFAKIGRAIKGALKKMGATLARPLVRYHRAIKLGSAEISKARAEKGFAGRAAAVVRFIGKCLFGKRGLAYSLFNYAISIVCMVLLFNIVTYANSMTYALELTVNGDFMGYVSSETVFTDAERIVQQRINYMDGNTEPVTFEAEYQLEAINYGETLTKYQLADKLLSSMDAEIEYAYGFYIGSSFYGALVDKTEIENTLEDLLDVYRTDSANETVAFETSISFEPGLYLTESIMSPKSIIEVITSKKAVASYYTAVNGDSPLGILAKLDLTMAEMQRLNPDFSEDMTIYVGDKFLITQDEPFLAVTVTRTEVYEESTAYETQYYEDNTRYQGSSAVMQDGINGTDRVTADVSYINGIEVRRKVTNRVTIEEPTPKIVANGTKPAPANASISNIEVGKMLWPVGGYNGGLISEMPYGYGGYYNHSGLDIAADYGTPIYAAASGTVIASGWSTGGYGYYIMIQHDNGIVTLYGHCSYLHVYTGQYVTQGEAIADVGSTGQSTGNHLHFEVRINGVCMNPINYLPWHQRASWCVEY